MNHARPNKIVVVEKPEREPVTLELAKEQCRVNHDHEDYTIQTYIRAAREACENFTGRALITQTRAVHYNCEPYGVSLELRGAPVQSVNHIKFHQEDGTITEMDDTLYSLTGETTRAMVTLNTNTTWGNNNSLKYKDGVEVEYVCGYGDYEDDIPAILLIGMLEYVDHLYTTRGADSALPPGVVEKWNQFRLVTL